MIFRLLLIAVCLLAGVTAFSPSASMAPLRSNYQRGGQLTMGNNAAFGIFSPAVYAAKFVLGEQKLNKIRGKAISLHSQAITEWCNTYGAYNMRLKLIKKAKKTGDRLGFLV